MNKTAIKNFAVWARNKLIADISYRAGLIGITESGIASALPQSTGTTEFYDIGTAEPYSISGDAVRQRRRLVELIERKEKETDYKTAYKYIIEEVAYTWFNRLIAIRFMEVNDYLPSHIRVLSSESGKMEPDLVTTPFDADLEFSREEEQTIVELKQSNQLDDLFRMLFIKQCNALNKILPALFENTSDYTELLLSLSVIDKEGVVCRLVHDIPEEDFDVERGGQVEIIGWLYQYYNIEPKDEAFSLLKKNVKITKERIPAATQLFTPDWIVRYMVENSLGRIWYEGHDDNKCINKWKYYIPEVKQSQNSYIYLENIRREYKSLSPENIKFIDPCMGSGHILVYAFDVFMDMYESVGYSQRDAARSIIENNLYGLDIDDRAFQMAYFAVMMKARQYNRRILSTGLAHHLCAFKESNNLNKNHVMLLKESIRSDKRQKLSAQLDYLVSTFEDAKEYGSLLKIANCEWDDLRNVVSEYSVEGQFDFNTIGIEETCKRILELINLGEILTTKYQAVVTNPPYMGITNGSANLVSYVRKNYEENKVDLFSVFMEVAINLLCKNGFCSLITQQTWMFISSFKNTRKMLMNYNVTSMNHLGTRAFSDISGEVVQSVAYCLRKAELADYRLKCIKLDETDEKEFEFFNEKNHYICNVKDFYYLPDSIFAYWLDENVMESFSKYKPVSEYADGKIGLQTGDNNTFLRLWFEVGFDKVAFENVNNDTYWVPYNKAGGFRRWYGNWDYVVNWKNEGYSIINCRDEKGKLRSRPQNREFYFKEGITWSDVCTGRFSMRKMQKGFIFDSCAPSMFSNNDKYLLALYNSKVAQLYLDFLTPTIHYTCGSVLKMPYIYSDTFDVSLVDKVIEIVKEDWDSFETSWEFKKHPLVKGKGRLETFYSQWEEICNKRYEKVKEIEETINRFFIELYELSNALSADVDDDYISVCKADYSREVRSLLSYAVGCILGRYSLDKEGVILAGGRVDIKCYNSYTPDTDGIIPITDEEYFEDDIVGKICQWLKQVFGETYLEDNLDFIARGLDSKGKTSREIIRNYFLNDFIKDHSNIYSVTGSGKRPIYWLFESGKQNGFKALVYMHRYDSDTIGNIRVDYLHRMQRVYESEINRMQDMIDHSTNAREVGNASKRKEKLQKQLKECREYDEKIGHLALSRIDIDLDDGVKVNYEKVQTASDGKKYQVLAKI